MAKATVLIMLALINAARANHPLELADDLAARAEQRARYFCDHPLSHDGWQAYFENLPYTVTGENLAKGFESPQATIAGLMASPAHRANLLNPDYRRIGIGESCGVVVQFFAN